MISDQVGLNDEAVNGTAARSFHPDLLQRQLRRANLGRPIGSCGPGATDQPGFSVFHRLPDGERIFELDAEVAHRAIHLRMAEQKLHRAEAAIVAIYLRNLGSPGSVGAWLEADRGHTAPHEAGILPSRNMPGLVKAPRPKMLRSDHKRSLEPSRDGFSRPLGNFKADQCPGFALYDRGAALDISGRIDLG